jgi:hypothetical protein
MINGLSASKILSVRASLRGLSGGNLESIYIDGNINRWHHIMKTAHQEGKLANLMERSR